MTTSLCEIQMGGARLKLQDPQSGGSECVLEIRGSSEHLTAAQSILQAFMASAGGGGPNMNPQQGSYQNMNAHPQAPYQNMNAPQQVPYQSMNNALPPQQAAPFPNMSAQQSSYQY